METIDQDKTEAVWGSLFCLGEDPDVDLEDFIPALQELPKLQKLDIRIPGCGLRSRARAPPVTCFQLQASTWRYGAG